MRTHLILLFVMVLGMALAGGCKREGGVAAKAPPSDEKLIQGEWKFDRAETNGQPVNMLTEDAVSITVVGDQIHITLAGKEARGKLVSTVNTFSLDQSVMPHTITMVAQDGNRAGMKRVSIYEISGNTLKMASASGRTPSDFSEQNTIVEYYTRK
jgi:uncharacterized protein (TIGR03067 family)